YAYDSDSVAEKRRRRDGFGFSTYPNFFALHAIHRMESQEWEHTKIYAATRVHFNMVQKNTVDCVFLEFQPYFPVDIRLGEATDEARLKWAAEINKPFTQILTIADGVPVLNSPDDLPEAKQ